MPSVLMLLPALGTNGATLHAEDLAVAFVERGLEVTIAAGGTGRLSERAQGLAEAGRLKMVCSKDPVDTDTFGQPGYVKWVEETIASVNADVVHAHTIAPAVALTLAGTGRAARVATMHSAGTGQPEGVLSLVWGMLAVLDRTICVSEELGREALRRGVSGSVVVEPYSSLPPRRERPAHLGEGPLVGFVGRYQEVKRPEVFLETAALLPEARFCMVGEGPLEGELRLLRKRLHLEERVRMLPWQPREAGAAGWFDVLTLTSESEGHPLVLKEALAAGSRIVATPVGDVPVMLEEAGHGHLVPVGDAEELARAIRKALAEPTPERTAPREKGVEEILKVYRDVLEGQAVVSGTGIPHQRNERIPVQ